MSTTRPTISRCQDTAWFSSITALQGVSSVLMSASREVNQKLFLDQLQEVGVAE